MPKDYAKRTTKPTHPGRLRYWFAILLSLMIVSSGVYFIAKDGVWQKKYFSFVKNNPVKVQKVSLAATNVPKPEPEVHYDFYTELPSMQVTQPQIAEKSHPTPPPLVTVVPKTNGTSKLLAEEVQKKLKPITSNDLSAQYVLQIAAFKNEIAASEYRISLLLGGFDANIVKTDNDPPIYRIQQGPYPSARIAKANQQRLLRKGIKSVVIKL